MTKVTFHAGGDRPRPLTRVPVDPTWRRKAYLRNIHATIEKAVV
ncbi:MAG: hypothetical protein ACFFGP_13735 [Promethearchaeota archaeon]